MIVTKNLAVQNQSTKSVSATEHVMANTMSVDEYFDELISQVQESLTRAFDDLQAGKVHHDARKLFSKSK